MGWYGVDLDGTLAHYGGFLTQGEAIGAPVPKMLQRVKRHLAAGDEVRIFTARASVPALVPPIEEWCEKHLSVRLPVTNVKDFGMLYLYDDRAIQIRINTGERVDGLE